MESMLPPCCGLAAGPALRANPFSALGSPPAIRRASVGVRRDYSRVEEASTREPRRAGCGLCGKSVDHGPRPAAMRPGSPSCCIGLPSTTKAEPPVSSSLNPSKRLHPVGTQERMGCADQPMVTSALPMVTDALPPDATALPDPNLLREEGCRFRTRQLEGELSAQSKLTVELEQSNVQLQQHCTCLDGMVRALLEEKKEDNAEITLLRRNLHELRGQHLRVLAERLVPDARLPHDPEPASKPAPPLQVVCLPDSAAWVDLYGGSKTTDGSDETPQNPPFQDFDLPECQPFSRCQSNRLSQEEKEEVKTRIMSDRGPSRRPSSSEVPLPLYDNANLESETQALPKKTTAGFSRGMKLDPGARFPGVDGGSLLSRHGNDARQGEPASSPLQHEDCSVHLRDSKGWRADANRETKKEDAGVGRSDEKPAPSSGGPIAASVDLKVGDQEHGEQRERHDYKAAGKVCAGEAARATPPASVLPTDIERTASNTMDLASAHVVTPSSGSVSDSVGPDGPEHDSIKLPARLANVQQGPPVAHGSPISGLPVASCSPMLGGGAEVYQVASAENPRVLAPPIASLAEPESMEVVASSASTDASVSSENSDVSSVSASSVFLSSASGFRRNAGRQFPYEAPLNSATQIDGVLGRPENKITVKSERLWESARTLTANDKLAKTESCDTIKGGCVPLEPDHVRDRYQYTTFCSACSEPRAPHQAVALCQLCPRMFCGLCAAGLGESVEGDSDLLLPGEKCVCLRRDSEFPKPPENIRPEAHLLEHLFVHDLSVQFREEVAVYDNPGYLGLITRDEMMDLGTMRKNMQRNRYDTARGQGKFRSDVKQIWLNCWKFAGCSPETTATPVPGIVSCARILDKMVEKFCVAYMEGPEELVSVGLDVPDILRLADDGFEDSDEEPESEPELEIADMEPPAAQIAGKKRKAVDDAPSVAGMEISEVTDRSDGGSASPATKQFADNLCILAGIGKTLLRAGSS